MTLVYLVGGNLMQNICSNCYYRFICAKGLTEKDSPCEIHRDENLFGGAFEPDIESRHPDRL